MFNLSRRLADEMEAMRNKNWRTERVGHWQRTPWWIHWGRRAYRWRRPIFYPPTSWGVKYWEYSDDFFWMRPLPELHSRASIK